MPRFPGTDRINRYTIEETVDTGVDDRDLNFDGDGLAEKIAVFESVSFAENSKRV